MDKFIADAVGPVFPEGAPPSVSMRERLARAICRYRSIDPDAPGDEPPASNWQDFLGDVDAILAELREPDEAMWSAGADREALGWDADPGAVFTAMIDGIRTKG